MTSLELQLKRLKQAAPVQDLAAERDFSSLLFEEREAANYTRQQFYDIGLSGLSHLCKIDSDFDSYEVELFQKSAINFNRALISKEEDEKLNASLERMIVRLSPYFHYFACKQVLEWLIHKYRIHAYNSELLAIAFLPFHASNSYGRLLRILRIQNPDWNFAADYAKEASPIPLNIMLRANFANSSFFMVSALSKFLVNSIEVVGEEYATTHLHTNFTFYASFMVHLFENAAKINDQLIARIMPYVGIALKSKVLPFKYAGMMITTRIVLSTSLTDEVLLNMLTLLLSKIKESWLNVALDTVVVICQTQKISVLPEKPILRVLRKREELGLVAVIWYLMDNYHVSPFLNALWATVFGALPKKADAVLQEDVSSAIVDILQLEKISSDVASGFLNAVLEALSQNAEEAANMLSQELRDHIHAIIIRFATVFDSLYEEWSKRDESAIKYLASLCQIEVHEIGAVPPSKRRRRNSHSTTPVD